MTGRPVAPERFAAVGGPLVGLATATVAAQRARFGGNEIVERRTAGWWEILRDTARDPMIWFLIGTGVLFAALGDRTEATILALAILPLVGMDAFLHRRTQASTEGLASRLASSAVVERDGALRTIPVLDVVVGDLATVATGETFPADGLVVAGKELQVDESTLTGEAFPVRKRPLDGAGLARAESGLDAEHWALAGTRLLTGQARVRVAYTGRETIYGEIVRSARMEGHARTPLQLAIGRLVNMLLIAAVAVCLVLAVVRLWQGFGAVDALLSAVTLAVAAIPEEFPVVFTFFLGVGVYRLARRQALVRRGVVVENIGRVSCICSDKTGTLTEGRLRLTHFLPAFLTETALLEVAAIASRREGGDPLDTALLDAADAAGIASLERLATFPFTEDRRRETAAVPRPDGGVRVVVKGAPETVLGMTDLDADARRKWLAHVTEFAAGGHKVIGCGYRDLPAWTGDEPTDGVEFAGLLAFEDPVREGVADAVARCRDAGIRVVMVTGDHPITATAIAAEVGLGAGAPRTIEAAELEGLPAADFDAVDVVARSMPAHKLALVRRFQAAGHVVAVTGDGVNDVPALQAADIGIAMGERGTRSAREAAAVVLLDDNFRSIVGAIAEGRQLFHNLQRSFAYLLMLHLPLVVTAAVVPVTGFPLLYLPIHVVWLELIIHPTALLAFQDLPVGDHLGVRDVRGSRGVAAPPRFFSRRQWAVIAVTGLAVTLAVMLGYLYSLDGGANTPHARAMAMLALIVAGATVTIALSGMRSIAARRIVVASLGSAAVLVQVPALAAMLHLSPLHADDLALAIGLGALAGTPAFLLSRRRRPPYSR
jgi:Ca2+-transporting ATPase